MVFSDPEVRGAGSRESLFPEIPRLFLRASLITQLCGDSSERLIERGRDKGILGRLLWNSRDDYGMKR